MERLNALILRLESELQSKGEINLGEQQGKPLKERDVYLYNC